MKWFEDIFTKTKVLIVSGIIGVAIMAFLIFNAIVISPYYSVLLPYSLIGGLALFLLICYKKGETSCQKALCGAILITIAYYYSTVAEGTYYRDGIISSTAFLVLYVITVLKAVNSFIIFFNHLQLQVDHKGEKGIITFSQIIMVITVLAHIIELVYIIILGSAMYFDYLYSVGMTSILVMITCIESRIQKYKLIRYESMQDGSWTEEKRQKYKKIFKI